MDLNADVGEREGPDGLADDLAILGSVTSVNVACGFHAGDASTMRAVCEAAAARGISVGGHVGYADRASFGRRDLEVDPVRLCDETAYQLGALAALARAAGARLAYVKPHGALYTRCAVDRKAADAVARAAAAIDPPVAVLGPPDSELLAAAAAHGLETTSEGFADRAYLADGRLVPRSRAGSVLDTGAALVQAERIAAGKEVIAVDGTTIWVHVGSLCVHSDTPGAADLARAVRQRLEQAGIEIRAFA